MTQSVWLHVVLAIMTIVVVYLLGTAWVALR